MQPSTFMEKRPAANLIDNAGVGNGMLQVFVVIGSATSLRAAFTTRKAALR